MDKEKLIIFLEYNLMTMNSIANLISMDVSTREHCNYSIKKLSIMLDELREDKE